VRSPLTANVLQVLSLHAPSSAQELLERVCKARGLRATELTSSQLEQIIPALCEALTASPAVAKNEAAREASAEVRGDLRLLLDTDRFRHERIAAKADKPLILVAEDDDDTRATFAQVLEDAGYVVKEAARGDEAWTALEQGPKPAAIVLDLMMPIVSGWQLWDRMQTVPALAVIPVVVVTASGLGPGSFGNTVVLRKPLSRTQLLGAVSVSVLR
jgi:two-component system, chemotaxis family, chemotaxis protein CheY